nr:hypothetical protein [Deltaproteobacteria bacterium]
PPAPAPAPGPANPIPWIPLDRKQLKIAGGVLGGVFLLILIGIAASRGSATQPAALPVNSGAEVVMDDAGVAAVATADAEADLVARARKLIAANKRDAALDLLDKGHAVFPNNATISYLAGNLYFGKLFWTAGIKSYRNAIRLEPSYKSDPELIKTALRGFLVTPSYSSEIAGFLRNDIGPAAAAFLEETARSHPTKGIRDRATAELKRYQ